MWIFLYGGVLLKMLRGVNKRIIEINNIEGGYFEKVLFFVNDDKKAESDSVLNRQAEKYVSDSCPIKYKKCFWGGETAKILLKMAISAGAGFAVGILLL